MMNTDLMKHPNRNSQMKKTGLIVLIFALLLSGGLTWYLFRDTSQDDPTIDFAERNLEMREHETLVSVIAGASSGLNDFTTDGCSGGLSDNWEILAGRFPEFATQHGEIPPWQECCISHDRQYHAGGGGLISAEESFEQRKMADLALKSCVVETGVQRSSALSEQYGLTEDEIRDIYQIISGVMYRAVRLGGAPCTGLPWRWGYGWPRCG